jgi:hypothetical protein
MAGHSMKAGMKKRGGMLQPKKTGGSSCKKGGAGHKMGGMHCGTKKGGRAIFYKNKTMKAGKKSAKKARKSRKSRKHKGGRKGCAMGSAKGFKSLLQASDTIQGLEAQQDTIQQQKSMAAKQYSDDRQSMKKALARDIQKPGMEVKNALRLQAAYGTPQKALAGFGSSTWYRA